MSLMSMRKKMASQKTITIVLWLLIASFIVGIFLFGNPNRNASNKSHYSGDAAKVIATVNGSNILAGEIDDAFFKIESASGSEVTMENAREKRKQIFSDQVQAILLEQALKEKNVKVDDRGLKDFARSLAEVQLSAMRKSADASAKSDLAEAAKPPKPTKPGEKPEAPKQPKSAQQYYSEALAQAMTSVLKGEKPPANPSDEDFKNAFIKYVLNKEDGGMYKEFRSFAAKALLGRAILNEINSGADQFTEEFVKQVTTQEVKARWIFITSQTNDQKGMDDAKAKAAKVFDTLKAKPAQFAEIAKKESRDFMTAGMGGDLNWIKAGAQQQMPIPIMVERFAFSNKPGALSEPMMVVSSNQYFGTYIGYGIVKVDGVRPRTDVPKDFNWAAEKDSKIFETRSRYEGAFGQEYLQQMRQKADIKATTPEMQIYVAEENRTDRTPEIAKQRELAADQADLPQIVRAAFQLDLAMTLYDKKDSNKKISLLENVIPASGQSSARLQVMLGEEYLKVGKKKVALEQFSYARTQAEGAEDRGMLEEIKKAYKAAGGIKEAQEIAQWLKDHPAPKQPAGGGGMGMPGGGMGTPGG